MRKRNLPDWLTGVLLTLYFLFSTATGVLDFTETLEMKSFDFRARLAAPRDLNPDIELVAITDEDLSEIGRFPWPRNVMATAIRNLHAAGAKVVALNILFPEAEESAGLKTVKGLKEEFEISPLVQLAPGVTFAEKLTQAVTELDNDAKLARAIKDSGNVILPVYFDTVGAGKDSKPPEFMGPHYYGKVRKEEWAVSSMIWLSRMKPLLPSFAQFAAGIGHINVFPDPDGSIRNQVHVVGYLEDIYVPSFPMAIVKAYKGMKNDDVTVESSCHRRTDENLDQLVSGSGPRIPSDLLFKGAEE